MHTEAFYQRTIVKLVVTLAKYSEWADNNIIDKFSGGTGATALNFSRKLSLTISGRAQVYALTVVIGIVLMTAWILRT